VANSGGRRWSRRAPEASKKGGGGEVQSIQGREGHGWRSPEEGSGGGETQNSIEVDLNPATGTGQHRRGGWRGFALARVVTKSGAGRENE
jgi:hypothetical protein